MVYKGCQQVHATWLRQIWGFNGRRHEDGGDNHQPAERNASIADLVKDWGGFEQLVAKINETGDVTVEHDVTLKGRSGAPRQIDVLVRGKQGLYEHLVPVECKFWKKRIERHHVDALANTVRDIGASKGVIFSTRGFQSGAIIQAAHENIDLFLVREPTDEEWGAPGRHFDIFIQVISLSIGNFKIHGSYSLSCARPSITALNIGIGDDTRATKTPIHMEGKKEKTLEDLIQNAARYASQHSWEGRPVRFNDGGYEGEIRYRVHVDIDPERPIQVFTGGGIVFVPKISFDVGVKILQNRLQIDRGAEHAFVLAVEDCVRRVVTAASRGRDDDITQLTPIPRTNIDPNMGPVYKNGSVACVWTTGYLPFDEFANLQRVPVIVAHSLNA